MKRSIKVISIVLMILAIILASTTVFAKDADKKVVTRPSEVTIDTTNTENVSSIGSRIIGIVKVVGTIVAVGMLIVIGIKYMMGSAEEKAEYKKTLFPYFIGAILIFAAVNLADMVYTWASSI